MRARTLASVAGLGLLGLACTGRQGPSEDSGGGEGSTSSVSTAGTTSGPGHDASDGSVLTDEGGPADSGGSEAATDSGAAPAGCDGTASYLVSAAVEDSGLGPTNAPITVVNCQTQPAYVRTDCCHGPTYFLERQNPDERGWHVSSPELECECSGPGEPLVVPPQGQIEIDSCPACFDAEPLCDVGSAQYRWTLFVGSEPQCEDCWQMLTTNAIPWYCEG